MGRLVCKESVKTFWDNYIVFLFCEERKEKHRVLIAWQLAHCIIIHSVFGN